MVSVTVVLDEKGLLRHCQVWGHAGAGQLGHDVVCAALSVLSRTALRMLAERADVSVQGDAPVRGNLWFSVSLREEGARPFLEALTTFLLEGFRSVSQEYPAYCTLHIQTEGRL
ncbi:ribosomal-processing cysteine protease Prp [Treponema sp. J25]|uniref:ribosomal-processing cysteine protease Prp n=1 Tax=Treponema sp. J25 TaxID=2094121 RepID=UPI00104BB53D|nr:ribosomal-processing cysteine protease Prp [Treponema sp. J25]TCW62381.1 ribosomal-processing cysteine protease Prp [Treponema sp. J25]